MLRHDFLSACSLPIEFAIPPVEEAAFRFPIVVDNEKQIWNEWGNSIWPSVYLIDKQGRIRYWWYGELDWQGAGGQEIMAKHLEELLAEGNASQELDSE